LGRQWRPLTQPQRGAPFSQRMREITRSVHNTSDSLVNAKLGVTMSDDSVWAEGLLVFYEIFKFLEASLERHKDSLIGDLILPGMARTEAFEADLGHFLGDAWREDYTIRPEVQAYLSHLRSIEEKNPYLLIAYVYHLYMGLFSGGQVLRVKRMMSLSSASKSAEAGSCVTSCGETSIGSMKKQLKTAINGLAENLDEETRQMILEEGVNVFKLNNTIIASVQGVNVVLRRRLFKLLIAVMLMCLFLLASGLLYYSANSIEIEGDVFSMDTRANAEL